MKTPALLDGKDLTPEFGWLFDEEKSVSQNGQELGFITGIPCMTSYIRHSLRVRYPKKWIVKPSELTNEIKRRLSAICENADYAAEIYECKPYIFVEFFWKEKTL